MEGKDSSTKAPETPKTFSETIQKPEKKVTQPIAKIVAPRAAPRARPGRFFSNLFFFTLGMGGVIYASDELTLGHIKEITSVKRAVQTANEQLI